jgi:hypothetical protein
MSGGGGSRNWDWTSTQVDCSTLVERTFLNSPVPAVVATLKVGDILQVTLSTVNSATILEAVADGGDIAGSLTPARLPQIVECIGKGFTYVAIVQEKNGGSVRVEIRPEAK